MKKALKFFMRKWNFTLGTFAGNEVRLEMGPVSTPHMLPIAGFHPMPKEVKVKWITAKCVKFVNFIYWGRLRFFSLCKVSQTAV